MDKEAVYKKFVDNGSQWYSIDKSKEPTDEERKIILEMKEKERQPKQEPKPQMDTATLMKEAERLLKKQEPKQQTKREKELEESRKKWDQYFKDNRGKIPYGWPKTIFDPKVEIEG